MNLKPITMIVRHFSLILALSLTLSACAGISSHLSGEAPEERDAANVAEARRLITLLESQNNALQYFKGIGKLKVRNNGKVQIDERVAWVGSRPQKISIAILISGFPAVKMASDGQWFYYLEVQGDKHFFKKVKASDASLKPLIAIPIYPHEIITLLAGQVPVPEHHSAYLKTAADTGNVVLILKRRWWGIVEKIYFDDTKTRVYQIEVFNRSGSLAYRVAFHNIKQINQYRIPFQFRISSPEGVDCQLDTVRYWADVPVSPSVFVLQPPE
jgi:hypothetical protein